jgi:hypothetical protein
MALAVVVAGTTRSLNSASVPRLVRHRGPTADARAASRCRMPARVLEQPDIGHMLAGIKPALQGILVADRLMSPTSRMCVETACR